MELSLIILAVLFLLPTSTLFIAGKGFSVELIHRDSIESPLYEGNLTATQRIQRLTELSKSYIRSFDSSIAVPQDVRPRVVRDGSLYTVQVRVGTNLVELHLRLSTGSGLTWTQCVPCNPCFPQDGAMYDPGASTTYVPIQSDHQFCKPPSFHPGNNGRCTYNFRFADDSYTRGVIGTESFKFGTETVPDVFFGCSHESMANQGVHNPKAGGVFGLNYAAESFARQLTPHIRSARFSYCLVADPHIRSHLRFGRDIVRFTAKTTGLILANDGYYVTLQDISVDGRRLHLPPDMFKLYQNGQGGCTLDVGVWTTALIRPAYVAVREAMVRYFTIRRLTPVDGEDMGGLDLCYGLPSAGVVHMLPAIDYHFIGATFHVAGRYVFMLSGTKLCLNMSPNDHVTLIGAANQRESRFEFDIPKRHVRFNLARCHIE